MIFTTLQQVLTVDLHIMAIVGGKVKMKRLEEWNILSKQINPQRLMQSIFDIKTVEEN